MLDRLGEHMALSVHTHTEVYRQCWNSGTARAPPQLWTPSASTPHQALLQAGRHQHIHKTLPSAHMSLQLADPGRKHSSLIFCFHAEKVISV